MEKDIETLKFIGEYSIIIFYSVFITIFIIINILVKVKYTKSVLNIIAFILFLICSAIAVNNSSRSLINRYNTRALIDLSNNDIQKSCRNIEIALSLAYKDENRMNKMCVPFIEEKRCSCDKLIKKYKSRSKIK